MNSFDFVASLLIYLYKNNTKYYSFIHNNKFLKRQNQIHSAIFHWQFIKKLDFMAFMVAFQHYEWVIKSTWGIFNILVPFFMSEFCRIKRKYQEFYNFSIF